MQLVDSYLRKYPHRSLGAHVLGHVGEISPSELKALKSEGYKLGDIVGQAGVEATYDTYLRGARRLGPADASTRAAGRRARSSRG